MVRFKSPYTLGKKMITKEKQRNQVEEKNTLEEYFKWKFLLACLTDIMVECEFK